MEEEKGRAPAVDFVVPSGSDPDEREGPTQSNSTGVSMGLGGTVHHLTKRVHVPWYRRYMDTLTGEERVFIQPYHELALDELDAAMRHVFGKYYKVIYGRELAVERVRIQMQQQATVLYKKARQAAVLKAANQNSTQSLRGRDGQSAMAICTHLERLRYRQGAPAAHALRESLWNIVKSQVAAEYFKREAARLRRIRALQRFYKLGRKVINIKGFISILMENHYSMTIKLSELPATEADSAVNKSVMLMDFPKKPPFDPEPFAYKRMDEGSMPTPVIMTLTKPWSSRNVWEIGDAVKWLYPRWVYHKYPLKVQMQLATVAWYTRIRKNRPIVRQGNAVTRFFFVLSGRVALAERIEGVSDERSSNFRVVKYVKTGERFGDEYMDVLNRKRVYNAYSATSCDLLAVDFIDYQHSLLQVGAESMPLHLAFLSRMEMFSEIPRKDLIRAAEENRIQLVYFMHAVVVTESVEGSDFVFVVMQGQCHTATRLSYPERSRRQLRLPGVTRSKPDKKPSRLTHVVQHRSDHKVSRRITRGVSMDREDMVTCRFMKSKEIEEDFGRWIGLLSESSLSMSKEEIASQIQNLRVVQALGSVYGPACMREIAEELAEKMHMNELINQEREEEMKTIAAKTRKLRKKLSVHTQQLSGTSTLKDLVTRAGQSLSHIETEYSSVDTATKSHTPAATTAATPAKRINVRHNSLPAPVSTPASEARALASKPTRKTVVTTQGFDPQPPKVKGDSDAVEDTKDDHDHEDDDYNLNDTQTTVKGKSNTSVGPGSKPIVRNLTSGLINVELPDRPVSYSAPISLHDKLDIIGNDFMNYNDGMYRPPDHDPVLISNGAELVLIAKSFLMERFYKYHKKEFRFPQIEDDD